jgi:hypothetical protein
MANEILTKSGTPIVWADVTDYAGDGGARTHQIDLTDVADGAARQGAKADLGATRAKRYAVTLCVEMAVAPASGAVVGLYWAASPHATAATMNPGGCTGADAAYTGTAGDSLDDSLPQLQFIGNLVLTSDTDPVLHSQTFTLFPLHRYGMPVVDNNGGQAMHSDSIECFVNLTPLIDEVQ